MQPGVSRGLWVVHVEVSSDIPALDENGVHSNVRCPVEDPSIVGFFDVDDVHRECAIGKRTVLFDSIALFRDLEL
jgi:hypothetical protein